MRHKFLILLEQLLYERDEVMEGIVEIDETYVPDSYKGIKRTTEKRGLSEEYLCISWEPIRSEA